MKWSLRGMGLIPGIDSFLKGFAAGRQTSKTCSPRAYNRPCCTLEQHAYNLYKTYSIERLMEMIRWREDSLKRLREEITGVGRPILRALKRALKDKQ